jgi:hypothetical protein
MNGYNAKLIIDNVVSFWNRVNKTDKVTAYWIFQKWQLHIDVNEY